jgi:hypothetical protein
LDLIENGKKSTLKFDAVFICTGLANQKVPLVSTHPRHR